MDTSYQSARSVLWVLTILKEAKRHRNRFETILTSNVLLGCILIKNKILTYSVSLLNITGWKPAVKWIYHEHEARMIHSLTTDRQS